MRRRGKSATWPARDIVGKMKLEEKIEELHGIQNAEHRRYVPPIPRLGIPPLVVTNGPAGAGPGDVRPQQAATAVPAPISLAATWDPRDAYEYGVIAGKKSRDHGNRLLDGSDVNIARILQNGRTFEAVGEDLLSRCKKDGLGNRRDSEPARRCRCQTLRRQPSGERQFPGERDRGPACPARDLFPCLQGRPSGGTFRSVDVHISKRLTEHSIVKTFLS